VSGQVIAESVFSVLSTEAVPFIPQRLREYFEDNGSFPIFCAYLSSAIEFELSTMVSAHTMQLLNHTWLYASNLPSVSLMAHYAALMAKYARSGMMDSLLDFADNYVGIDKLRSQGLGAGNAQYIRKNFLLACEEMQLNLDVMAYDSHYVTLELTEVINYKYKLEDGSIIPTGEDFLKPGVKSKVFTQHVQQNDVIRFLASFHCPGSSENRPRILTGNIVRLRPVVSMEVQKEREAEKRSCVFEKWLIATRQMFELSGVIINFHLASGW
jgi:hypothetical protein